MTTHLPDSAVGPQTMTRVTRRLIPFLVLLYFINYLDRVNISFAGPNGMNEDLAMSAKMFGFASGIFFIGYLLLEVPSNIALNKFGGRRWIARIMLTWGIISSAIAFVPNAETLVVLRFLLGVAEAGFFPGIILYLTFWFPERHRSKAISMFMVAVPVSTADRIHPVLADHRLGTRHLRPRRLACDVPRRGHPRGHSRVRLLVLPDGSTSRGHLAATPTKRTGWKRHWTSNGRWLRPASTGR